ncbi:MAG: RT0821/Lpp0805 family surface protein [Pseudomonadota bacterium]|nr:RT0821/Lpp0805 family surface protein [Pseudomonadota bacterium]
MRNSLLHKGAGWAVALTLALSLLAGCETSPYQSSPSKADIGTVAGGALGAAVGSQIGEGKGRAAAVIGGAILGGLAGRYLGRYMEQRDQQQAALALENAQTNETVAWTNPDTGYDYQFTPTGTYEQQGRPCREFVTRANIDGVWETVNGVACRQPDGTWEVVSG